MTEMLDVQPGESVYDLSGSGGMLFSCITPLRRAGALDFDEKAVQQDHNLLSLGSGAGSSVLREDPPSRWAYVAVTALPRQPGEVMVEPASGTIPAS